LHKNCNRISGNRVLDVSVFFVMDIERFWRSALFGCYSFEQIGTEQGCSPCIQGTFELATW
jgi:hypothetical protein